MVPLGRNRFHVGSCLSEILCFMLTDCSVLVKIIVAIMKIKGFSGIWLEILPI